MTNTLSKVIIGIMGPATTTKAILDHAYELGQLIANERFIVLTGGTNLGVMNEALKGAKSVGGLTIGILKDDHVNNMSQYIDIPIVTGLGSARNNINVLTSSIVVACGIGIGTASEVALALKAKKDVILLCSTEESCAFFKSLHPSKVWVASEPVQVLKLIKNLLLAEN